jgi:hypothetical protein
MNGPYISYKTLKKYGNGPPSVGVEPTYHIGHRKPEVIYYITEI